MLVSADLLRVARIRQTAVCGPVGLIELEEIGAHSPMRITITGAHLPPFKDGFANRLRQLRDERDKRFSAGPMILIGDLNMRNDKEVAVHALGFVDAFHELGRPSSGQSSGGHAR